MKAFFLVIHDKWPSRKPTWNLKMDRWKEPFSSTTQDGRLEGAPYCRCLGGIGGIGVTYRFSADLGPKRPVSFCHNFEQDDAG